MFARSDVCSGAAEPVAKISRVEHVVGWSLSCHGWGRIYRRNPTVACHLLVCSSQRALVADCEQIHERDRRAVGALARVCDWLTGLRYINQPCRAVSNCSYILPRAASRRDSFRDVIALSHTLKSSLVCHWP